MAEDRAVVKKYGEVWRKVPGTRKYAKDSELSGALQIECRGEYTPVFFRKSAEVVGGKGDELPGSAKEREGEQGAIPG